MKRIIPLAALAAGLCFAVSAAPPAQDMSATSIGIGYSGFWRGETITKEEVNAQESVHHLTLHYAPFPYLLFSAGLGTAGYSVDTCRQTQFKGTYGLSPSFGIDFYTPYLLAKVLRITAGANGYYLYCKNKNESFIYSGLFASPSAGIVVSIGNYIDIEAGGRGLVIVGQMERTRDAAVYPFSNNTIPRGYCSAVLHTPSEGAHFRLQFDASPAISSDLSNGLTEASIGFSMGFLLRRHVEKITAESIEDANFPGYKEMKKREEKMKEEIMKKEIE